MSKSPNSDSVQRDVSLPECFCSPLSYFQVLVLSLLFPIWFFPGTHAETAYKEYPEPFGFKEITTLEGKVYRTVSIRYFSDDYVYLIADRIEEWVSFENLPDKVLEILGETEKLALRREKRVKESDLKDSGLPKDTQESKAEQKNSRTGAIQEIPLHENEKYSSKEENTNAERDSVANLSFVGDDFVAKGPEQISGETHRGIDVTENRNEMSAHDTELLSETERKFDEEPRRPRTGSIGEATPTRTERRESVNTADTEKHRDEGGTRESDESSAHRLAGIERVWNAVFRALLDSYGIIAIGVSLPVLITVVSVLFFSAPAVARRKLKEQARIDYEDARGTAHLELMRNAYENLDEKEEEAFLTISKLKTRLKLLHEKRKDELLLALEKHIATHRLTEVPGIGEALQEQILSRVFQGRLADLRQASLVRGVGQERYRAILNWQKSYERRIPSLIETDFPGKGEILARSQGAIDKIKKQISDQKTLRKSITEKIDRIEPEIEKISSITEKDFRDALLGSHIALPELTEYQQGVFPEWKSPPDWFKRSVLAEIR